MIKPPSDTRERLLTVAQDLIQKRGVNGFSFQDLSESVGIRKASVHHHFATKAELIESLMERFLVQFASLTQGVLVSKTGGRTKLTRYCKLFLETLKTGKSDKNCLCGMLMAEVASVEKPVQIQIQQFVRNNLSVVETILAEGAKDGSLVRQKNIKSTALLVFSTLEGGLLIARSDQGPKQLSDIVTRLVALLSTN